MDSKSKPFSKDIYPSQPPQEDLETCIQRLEAEISARQQIEIALRKCEDKLKKASRESIEREAQAYEQGRLEIIDTILHNIGNALNSVTIGIGTIQEKLLNNRLIRHLLCLADAVKAHQDDFSDYVRNDPQGREVAPFIIVLAHDLEKHNEGLAKIANRISERVQHIGDIIQMDKTFGKKRSHRKYTNLRKTIYSAYAALKDPIEHKNIKFIIDCDNAPKEVSIKGDILHQILVELIKNSVNAINRFIALKVLDGMAFIKIRCYAESDSLILEVTHNGISIEKKEAISQSGCINMNSQESLTNLINKCGGQIQASSESDKGTTTRVLLPIPPTVFER